MNDLVLSGDFSNSGLGVTLTTLQIEGEVLFLAKEVSDYLEYGASGDMLRNLDEEDIKSLKSLRHTLHACSAHSNIINNLDPRSKFITESGLYSAIFGSRKKEAKAFKRWVTKEVLPSIRKNGSYSLISQQLEGTVKQLESTKAELSLVNQRIENGHNIVRKLNREQKLLQSDLTSVTRVKNELELQNKALVFQLKGNRSELTIRQYLGVSGLSCYDANKKLIYDPREIVTWLTSQTFKGRDWNWKKAFTNAQYESIFFSSDVLVKHHNHIINMALEILEKSNH